MRQSWEAIASVSGGHISEENDTVLWEPKTKDTLKSSARFRGENDTVVWEPQTKDMIKHSARFCEENDKVLWELKI